MIELGDVNSPLISFCTLRKRASDMMWIYLANQADYQDIVQDQCMLLVSDPTG